MPTPTSDTPRDPAHRRGRHRREAGSRLVTPAVIDAPAAGMPTDTTPPPDRSETIFGIVVYLLLAAGGVWLIVKFGGSAGLVKPIFHGVGYVLAAQGVWLAARECRRLFEPEVVADIEAEEAEREKRAHECPPRLVGVVFFWLLTLLVIGGLVAYALDDSGLHGERTLTLTLLFGGFTFAMVGFGAWTALMWWRGRTARHRQPDAACARAAVSTDSARDIEPAT
jgi:hypothetical protein